MDPVLNLEVRQRSFENASVFTFINSQLFEIRSIINNKGRRLREAYDNFLVRYLKLIYNKIII